MCTTTFVSALHCGFGRTRQQCILITSNIVRVAGFVGVSAGNQHSLALGIDGSLWAAGDGYHGQLGDGTPDQDTRRKEWVQVISTWWYLGWTDYNPSISWMGVVCRSVCGVQLSELILVAWVKWLLVCLVEWLPVVAR